jgi:hypothetical protein
MLASLYIVKLLPSVEQPALNMVSTPFGFRFHEAKKMIALDTEVRACVRLSLSISTCFARPAACCQGHLR